MVGRESARGWRWEAVEEQAAAAEDLVDNEHAGVGAVLVDDVLVEDGALLCGGHGTERQLDRVDIIVDGLGEAHDSQGVVVPLEESSKVGGSRVGVVAANGVQYRDTILDQLVSGNLLRILAFLYKTALDAILDIRELYSAVADWRATTGHKHGGQATDLGSNLHILAFKQALQSRPLIDLNRCESYIEKLGGTFLPCSHQHIQ